MQPTKKTVMEAIAQYDQLGHQPFLDRYASGVGPRSHYFSHGGRLYPVKAIWAAAFRPVIAPKEQNTRDARAGLKALGFDGTVDKELGRQFDEGRRFLREVVQLARSRGLVEAAKKTHGTACQVCHFDFDEAYGELADGYIECHHLVPLAERGGEGSVTSVEDVAVLCANCHRMVHRKPGKLLSLKELRTAMEAQRRSR